MKRCIFALILCTAAAWLPAQGKALYLIGYEHGFFTEKITQDGSPIETEISSPGAVFSMMVPGNGFKPGWYVRSSFLFPTTGTLTNSSGSAEVDFTSFNNASQITLSTGLLFMADLDKNLSIFASFGPEMASFDAYYEAPAGSAGSSVTIASASAGIAADIGFAFRVGSSSYITAGTALSYDFYLLTAQDDETASSYSLSSARPYIGFAFR